MATEENKILIVDDQRANRLAMQHILEPLNLAIYQASSGREALNQIAQHDFAVILMDVVMPGIDGYETTKLIRTTHRFRKLPVVMITSHDKQDQYLKAYEAGAVDYITKPVEPIVLVNKVNQFVELHKQRLGAQKSRHKQEQMTARMQTLLNSAGEGILGIDRCGKITFANPKACELLRIDRIELILRSIQEFIKINHGNRNIETFTFKDDAGIEQLDLVTILKNSDAKLIDQAIWRTAEKTDFYVEYNCEVTKTITGEHNGGVVTFQDVTERKIIEEKLVRLANFDPLTNLANRAYFHDTLVRSIAQADRRSTGLALRFLALDPYKNVIGTLGHDAGDQLLREVSKRLGECIRSGDLAARLGGDEFAIILYDVTNLAGIVKIAEKLTRSIHEPMELQDKQISISTSVGIAVYQDKTMDAEALLKAADIAMYAAKSEGRNTFQFFEPEMQQRAEARTQLQNSLTQAIREHQLCVFYQPKISTQNEKLVGLEALIRWTTDDGEMLKPDAFIPAAEESGLIHELGDWIVHHVCAQISVWQKLPEFNDMSVSINVSAHQLKTGEFSQMLSEAISTYDIRPQLLGIELTETTVMTNPAIIAKELNNIRALGIRILIDDFGTGFSSLYYLKHLPIDVLKIDQRFIHNISIEVKDEEIIKLIIAMAHTLGFQVIAEGVETTEQLAFLSIKGCDLVQGHYFSEALSVDSTTQMLSQKNEYYRSQFASYHSHLAKPTGQKSSRSTV